jgi:hypothetical protein
MKTTLFALCFLFATAAFGQSAAVLSNEVQVLELPSHPRSAYQQPPASEQSLLERSSYTIAQGERPLWEVAPPPNVTTLGDIARMLKKEHDSAKKAEVVWVN